VLKVGPALTHAYRQAIYALDALSPWMNATFTGSEVSEVMERLMCADPSNWRKHYSGSDAQLRLLRHFSYADRIRYYWNQPAAAEQIGRLMARLDETRPPVMVLEQFFAPATLARAGRLESIVPDWRKALVYAQIQEALAPYYASPAGPTR